MKVMEFSRYSSLGRAACKCVLAAVAIAGPSCLSLGVASEDLHRLFDEYWAFEMEANPFDATWSGDHQYNDRVPDASPEEQKRLLQGRKRIRETLAGIDRSVLSDNDVMSAEILDFILKHAIELGAFEGWKMPFVSDSGFHTTFGYVVGTTPFKNESDYRNYIKRLSLLPQLLEQHQENMRSGLAAGFTQPQAILEKTLSSFDALVTDNPEDHPYFRPFSTIPDSIDSETRRELEREGRQVLAEKLIPANRRLVDFMRGEYLPQARQSLGATDQPNGKAYYEAQIRYYTSLDEISAEEIYQKGLQEVKRIRSEMDEVIEESGFKGTFEAFLEFLRTDPQFYAKTPEELLMRAAWISKQTDGRLPAFFGKLPRQPYSVEPVPDELAPNYTGGRYVPASPGASKGGQYWVNTYALETRSLYQLVALSLHEGVPGHHLQISLAYEIENAPKFRKQFYPHAYGEGWGLYSEKLGVEMGLYKTPYDHFGRLSYEMWRACRLVVDTGLHSKNWTRQQAVDYLSSNTALSMHTIGTEVDRYIAWPGQALSYKMGELTIWELRRKAEETLGDDFDIREFHDAVLEQGGLPLDVLRAQIEKYIKRSAKE
ncbi:MAG: hypothetical protein ACI92G_001901 [Candidatus Pelagisphaera sp.]|jgi:uncharacterized protein (DUF885 family)